MPQIIKPTTFVKNFTTSTSQGEVTINLNLVLTIHTDQNGVVSVSATPATPKQQQQVEEKIPDYVPMIPDLEPADLIDFGKDVES